MCTQVNSLFKCGHRAFSCFDNCPLFGKSCLGAGAKHRDARVDRVCNDCLFRASHVNTPAGGSPDSHVGGGGGGAGAGDGAGAGEKKSDPWWDNDPWRQYRKG